jgi:hypothetical protein
MTDITTDTLSQNKPVIKTDLIVPFKALEIYRNRIEKSINYRLEAAHRDIKDCAKHRGNKSWDLERRDAENKISLLKDIKKCLYVSRIDLQQLHNREFYFTRELREPQKKSFAWRNQVLIRDNFICKRCGFSNGLEAHHIYSYKHEPELRYDINNGITLCSDCHKEFHRVYGVFTNMEDLILFLGVGNK